MPKYKKHSSFETEFIKNNGHIIYWPKYSYPLTVLYSEAEPDYFKDAIVRSTMEWNRVVGKDVFMTIELAEDDKRLKDIQPKIIVSKTAKLKNNIFTKYYGQTKYVFYNDKTGKILTTQVFLCDDMDIINYYGVAMHEFGHALGLKHDKDIKSIMYGDYNFARNSKIQGNDIELIRILVF